MAERVSVHGDVAATDDDDLCRGNQDKCRRRSGAGFQRRCKRLLRSSSPSMPVFLSVGADGDVDAVVVGVDWL